MRKLILSAVLLGMTLSAQAQTLSIVTTNAFLAAAQAAPPPAGHTWARVQSLPSNTSLHISATTHNAHCRLKSADADSLTCVFGDGTRTETYQRTDIRSIKVPHRGRSTVAGLAIGAGAGIITGAASGGKDQLFSRGELASAFAAVFGVIGALIGGLTDFTQATVYRA